MACEPYDAAFKDGKSTPLLVAELASPDAGARTAAAQRLAERGPSALPYLERALLPDGNPMARLLAAEAILRLVPAHVDAGNVVIELLTTPPSAVVGAQAREDTLRIGAPLEPALRALLAADPCAEVRAVAGEVLEHLQATQFAGGRAR
jgi:hypothetical protein